VALVWLDIVYHCQFTLQLSTIKQNRLYSGNIRFYLHMFRYFKKIWYSIKRASNKGPSRNSTKYLIKLAISFLA
jgi:hypothetical protein